MKSTSDQKGWLPPHLHKLKCSWAPQIVTRGLESTLHHQCRNVCVFLYTWVNGTFLQTGKSQQSEKQFIKAPKIKLLHRKNIVNDQNINLDKFEKKRLIFFFFNQKSNLFLVDNCGAGSEDYFNSLKSEKKRDKFFF